MYDVLKEAVRLAKLETKRLDTVIQKLEDDTMYDDVKVWALMLDACYNRCSGQLLMFLGTEREVQGEMNGRLDVTGGTGSYRTIARPTAQELEFYAAKKKEGLPGVRLNNRLGTVTEGVDADDDEDPVERERERCIDILDDADDSLADLKKKLTDAHPSAKDTIDCTVTACQMILSTATSRMRTER
jgi:hypothetical protein